MAEPTYLFENGKVYTQVEGKVVHSVPEDQFGADPAGGGHPIQGEQQMPEVPYELRDDLQNSASCPSCGAGSSPEDSFCAQCGEPLAQEGGVPGADTYGAFPPEGQGVQPVANTITTPNGLKGKILGRVATVWGEEVTVRFENGTIKRIPVASVSMSHEASAKEEDKTAALAERLGASYQTDKGSLVARRRELEAIKRQAHILVADGDDEAHTLHIQASAEIREIDQALAHIASGEGEAMEPFAPITNMPAVEQASTNGTSADWLDKTIAGIHAEAQATNYEKLLDEGPEHLVAGLEDNQIADAGVTRAIASRWIRSHTVGADENLRDKYEAAWLERVEALRKDASVARKEVVKKEAASSEVFDGKDEQLFL